MAFFNGTFLDVIDGKCMSSRQTIRISIPFFLTQNFFFAAIMSVSALSVSWRRPGPRSMVLRSTMYSMTSPSSATTFPSSPRPAARRSPPKWTCFWATVTPFSASRRPTNQQKKLFPCSVSLERIKEKKRGRTLKI